MTNTNEIPEKKTLPRRRLLIGAAVGGSAVAAGALVPALGASAAEVAPKQQPPTRQVPGFAADIDTSRATPEVAALFSAFFRDKSKADVEATMSHFAQSKLTYIDATVGLANFTWQSQHDVFAQFMPNWPAGSGSYPSRIIGDATSAVVFYTDTAGLFGPAEIRSVGVVNFERGKVVRWIDYWDGRHFGLTNLAALKIPDSQFPTDFKERTVGETAPKSLQTVARGVAAALAAEDYTKALSYFSPDGVLVDHPAHLQLVGVPAIGRFLASAGRRLPFVGTGRIVRHVVGSRAGGAYEWTAPGAVPRGMNAIELDSRGRITRLDAMWDGSRITDDTMLALASAAIER